MDLELSPEEAIWQKICTAEATWMEEIKDRHGVTISPDSDEVNGGLIFSVFSVSGQHTEQACKDLTELNLRTDMVRQTMGHIAGSADWCKREHTDANLWGRTPIQAIHDLGLDCIDCVLIGPVEPSASLLAADQRLYHSAKTRAMYMPGWKKWTLRIQATLALADSMRAASAVEEALKKAQ